MSLPSRERGLKLNKAISVLKWELPSLPSRERGLKFNLILGKKISPRQSLPSRERGLKSQEKKRFTDRSKSLPSRERGLKFFGLSSHYTASHVAPLAGAWIEISSVIGLSSIYSRSLPSRERGLKY